MPYRFLLPLCFLLVHGLFAQAQVIANLPDGKLSVSLANRLVHAGADSTDVIIVFTGKTAIKKATSYRVLHTYQHTATVRIPADKIPALVRDSSVRFADAIKKPKEELTTGSLDLAVNKLNSAHARFPSITGTGIVASVKEQQFDTTDIDYKGRYRNTAAAAATFTTHAAIMATTLAGAGNSSPFATGAAPAATVTSTSFESLLPESDAYYQQAGISIQNHSYGTVPENYYGAEAAAYDQSVLANPTLVHVFSAGNSGTTTGVAPYTGLQGWSNLTGNFKTAKNVIVVGAIDSFYQVAPASSKGPAFDGRIKPELVAFGEDGSSGAAALTSGTVALVQQAYFNQKHTLPAAALVKAVLLNSADDLYAKHVDYTSGYGSLNGYEALQTIAANRFFEDSTGHGVLKKFAITVPPHATQVKITLAWTDVPATVNSAKALVNDLDVILKNTATGERWQPWVLHSGASETALLQPATRQQDTVNNVEQVTVDSLAAGSYTIEVYGRHVTTATQAFDIAYQVDTAASFEWTFPTVNDPVQRGKTNIIRWQTTLTGKGILDYRLNNQNWQQLSDTLTLETAYYKWLAPDTAETAQLRLRVANRSIVTDTFVISKATMLQPGFACADSALLSWNALPPGNYQLYSLGDRYLQPAFTTTDTFAILKMGNYATPYFSVAPLINGRAGLKSYSLNVAQGAACYIQGFYLQAQEQDRASFTALLGTVYHIAAVSFQKLQQNGFVTLQTIQPPAATSFSFTDSSLIQGGNRYRLQVRLQNGAILTSDEISIYQYPNAAFFMYPNPVRSGERVTLLSNYAGNFKVNIFAATGLLVRQLERAAVGNTLSTNGLPAGVYVIQIVNDDGSRSTQKLVVY